jgi:hypothetical protein
MRIFGNKETHTHTRDRIEFHNSLALRVFLKTHCGTTMVRSLAATRSNEYLWHGMAYYLHNEKEISVTIVVVVVVIISEVQTLECSKMMMMMMINYVYTVLCCVCVGFIWTLNDR